jgi:nucleotide-binding universal stress UspA family protein
MRKILIATDGSYNALTAVSYVGNLYQSTSNLEVTIQHVFPAVPPIYLEEKYDPRIRKKLTAWKERREEEAKNYLSEASKVLQRAGVEEEQIQTKFGEQVVGAAQDIMWEADAKGHNAIVIGKKGLSRLEEFFLGSITNKLLELSVDHPVWAVDGDLASKKVMIAMDETEHAIDLAAYAAKMLARVDGVEILLYHCCTPFSEETMLEDKEDLKDIDIRYAERKREKMSQFFAKATAVLVDLGIDKNSIDTRFHFETSGTDKRVSKAILSDMKSEKFGTLILGRKGSTRSREFRLGSVCLRLLSEAKNCAIWIV